ncbi:MAG: sensor histidine kinase [Candidatus Obscuribacter sp.]|nr:sensor histidine kinase [Candidatus Obscuribacter sp.]MBP6347977.1 sensor histidine kinase [Candidatus Obscuribacter sp.]MBP6591430.1 sensor histidine kinase [Candidatus Obscuribacter sp.]MBP7575144.1 sensor histidine kinase [Candidatus Obscuribacter sp.]
MSDFLKHFMRTRSSRDLDKDEETATIADIQSQFDTHAHIKIDNDPKSGEDKTKQAEELSRALLSHAKNYFESRLVPQMQANPLHLRFSQATRIAEPVDWVVKQEQRSKVKPPSSYFRWKVTGAPLILTTRAGVGVLEFFVVPEKEVPHITMSEFGSRFRGRFVLAQSERGLVWTNNKTRLSAESSCEFIERLMDEIVETAIVKSGNNQGNALSNMSVDARGFSEQRLELEKNNLLFKLLNQQEELKNQLARDLHDSVIADLMMLKRYLSGDRKLTTEETIEIIDETILQLRDIVNDYSPRQLQEWGLKVGVEDLLDRIERRTGIETALFFAGELPRFPDLVSLHIFRVIQEALNNIEKHASASRITVDIKAARSGQSVFKIIDNGRGFDTRSVRMEADGSHSFGLEGMRERIELIRCFYPGSLDISSIPGEGTTITLSISTAPTKPE